MEELRRMVEAGEHLAAVRRFEERLTAGELGVAELALGSHLASVAYYHLGELFKARMHAERAVELGGQSGDLRLQLRAWSNLVEFAQELGDTHLAIDCAERWLSNVHKEPDEASRRAQLHFNLALVYRQRRDPAEALRQFEQALSASPAVASEFRLLTMQMMAWLMYEGRQIADGDDMNARAAALISESNAPLYIRREQLLLKAWRAYHLGEHLICTQLCEEFIAGEAKIRQQYWACAMIAGCGLQLYPDEGKIAADLKQAILFYTERCGQLAMQLKESRLINAYNQLRSRVQTRWSDCLAG